MAKAIEDPICRYDVVIIDFPDPSNYGVGKLYTTTFYGRLRAVLGPENIVVVQSTSPYSARRAFWCIDATMAETGLSTHAYHVLVPSFGEWGFVLARTVPFDAPVALRPGARDKALRYLTGPLLASLFIFPADMARPGSRLADGTGLVAGTGQEGEDGPAINRLNDQVLVRLYDEEWGRAQ